MAIRVILVDDHEVMRQGLALLLDRAGIEVVGTAADGRAGVSIARDLQPEVCVMDVSMPEMNGFEAITEIRRRSPATRIVMLSMHADRQHVFAALAAGATGYVLKDAAGEEVVAAVRAAHAGRRFISRALGTLEERDAKRGPIASLSARERQVLQLVAEGKSSAEIAKLIHLSPKSVDTYRSRLMKKLGVADAAALVKFAVRHGLTPPA